VDARASSTVPLVTSERTSRVVPADIGSIHPVLCLSGRCCGMHNEGTFALTNKEEVCLLPGILPVAFMQRWRRLKLSSPVEPPRVSDRAPSTEASSEKTKGGLL
jgi:hypothetical protein